MDRSLHLRSADPIELLDLSKRVFNALRRSSYETVGEVIELVESGRLMQVRNVGRKSAAEIKAALTRVQIVDEPRPKDESEPKSEPARMEKVETPVISVDVIDWQVDLVRKQISAGLLHEQAKIGGRPLSHWLSGTQSVDRRRAYETMASIIGGSLNVCEELAFLLDQVWREDYIEVLLSRYGYEAKTLEEIGSEIGVTRERVRQIGETLEGAIGAQVIRVLNSRTYDLADGPTLLRTQTALLIARDMELEIAYESWKDHIISSGLIGHWPSGRYSSFDPVEVMIAVCNLLADCETEDLKIPTNLRYAIRLAVSGSPELPAKILRIRRTLPKKIVRLVKRHVRFSGGVYARWLSQEIGRSLADTKDILQALGYRPASDNWFVPQVRGGRYTVTGHDVFHHALRKMFQYCGKLSTDDVCFGLQLAVSRTRFPVPPPRVMEETMGMYGYECEDGLWYWGDEMDEDLSGGESVIIGCFEQHGPVVHHSELAEAFVDSRLSFASLHRTLQRSPLFERIDTGLYKIRGTLVARQDIERAMSAAEKVSVNPEILVITHMLSRT